MVKGPLQGLSRCHTKRRIGTAVNAHPYFGEVWAYRKFWTALGYVQPWTPILRIFGYNNDYEEFWYFLV